MKLRFFFALKKVNMIDERRVMRYALCVMRYALCVMRYALMRYALCVL